MDKDAKILVAGNTGMVGSAIVRELNKKGFNNLVFVPYPEYDLRNQSQVNEFFKKEKPSYVFLAAAKVGGINANNYFKAEFIYDNMMIEFNVIHASYIYGVEKLLFLGSSCIYPRNCSQPIREEYLLTGPLEKTNEPYAIAKISGLKMCDYYREQYGCDFISVMPTNLYGPNDNYNLETSHVFPALIRKIHLAKCLEQNDIESLRKDLAKQPISLNYIYDPEWDIDKIKCILKEFGISKGNDGIVNLILWGSGSPFREFLYVDDLADSLLFLMHNYSEYGHINIGTGIDQTIKELADIIKNIIGFKGNIKWDKSKPDGTPRKLLDVSRLNNLGWEEKTKLQDGIIKTYNHYREKS